MAVLAANDLIEPVGRDAEPEREPSPADADGVDSSTSEADEPSPKSRRRSVADFEPIPDWLPESALEHVAPSSAVLLTRVWGTPAAVNALRALVFDQQGMVRRWAPQLRDELMLLCELHRAAHPGALVPGAPRLPDFDQLPLLETGYRRVLERLLKSWGHVEAFAVVCHDLFFDHRGDRAGWPAEVFEDLVMLQQIHDRVHGRLPPDAEPWRHFLQPNG